MAVRAPELRAKGWCNGAPLTLEALRGRPVLLEFFTYGCINCANNLRTLKNLHARYGETVAFVGVHSPKFAREKEADALHRAVERLGIPFPVADDADHFLAERYALKGWPTTVLVDGRGYIVGNWSGEQPAETLEAALAELGMTECSNAAGQTAGGEGLRFPENICATEEGIAVANTGAGSVWFCDTGGNRLACYGGFGEPVGLAWEAGTLYVSDRSAGSVVRIDTCSGRRERLLEHLRAPSALAVADGMLFVAEAAAHRITAYTLEGLQPAAVWGNRFEALRDGAFEAAQLAQPSAMSLLHERLWFVDAESSALRYIEGAEVRTAVGEGLFTYGDSDAGEILLQHPQGAVAGQYGDGCGGGRIFVADTYNNKVKVYDPDSGTMMTLVGNLHGPCGLAKKGCTLYIADTDAHRIVAFDLPTMSASHWL